MNFISLQKRAEFKTVYDNGRYAADPWLVMHMRPSGLPGAKQGTDVRLGISVSRKVGNAVVRNRLKRQIREWFRQNAALTVTDCDIVVAARATAADCPDVGRTLTHLCRRHNVL